MVGIYGKKRTKANPVLKKSVCVILPRIDLNEFLRKKKRRSLTRCNEFNAGIIGNSSPNNPWEQVRLQTKKRIRIKKEKSCVFHNEVDLENVEQTNSSDRSEFSFMPLSHLHEINESICYMCGPVQESKAEVWNEIRRLQNVTESRQEDISSIENRSEILTAPESQVDEEILPTSRDDSHCTVEVANQAVQTDVNLLSCSYCPSLFSNLEYLLHHETVHAKVLECVLCPANFVKKSDLQMHMKLHVQLKYYTCVYCSQYFKKKSDLKVHLNGHYNERSFRCTTCSAVFTQNSQLRDHQKLHKPENVVKKFIHIFRKVDDDDGGLAQQERDRVMASVASSVDSVESVEPVESVESVESVEPVESVESIESSVPFNASKSVQPSITQHFYSCDKCTLNFRTLAIYKKHMMCHTRNKGNFVCKYCSGRFLRKVAFVNHLRFSHSNLLL